MPRFLQAAAVLILLVTPLSSSADEGGPAADASEPFETRTNVVLAFPRLIWELATYPVGAFTIYAEQHDLQDRVYDLFTNADRTRGILPQVQIGGETGTGGALRVFARGLDRDAASAEAAVIYSGGRGQRGRLALRLPRPFGSSRTRLRFDGDLLNTHNRNSSINGAVRDDPDRKFKILRSDVFVTASRAHRGSGPETTVPVVSVDTRLGYSLRDFRPRSGGSGPLTDPGATFEARQLRGIGERMHYFSAGVTVRVDRRDYRPPISTAPHPFYGLMPGEWVVEQAGAIHHIRDLSYPRRGFMLEAGARWARGTDAVQFAHLKGEFQVYLPLFRIGRVLAIRGRIEKAHPIGSGVVPFPELVTVGGDGDARGFRRANFRGLGSIVLNVEYRYPIWDTWNAFLFWDEGQVFDAFSDAELGAFRTSLGGGITLRAKRHLLAKLQVGHSRANRALLGLALSQEF